MCKIVEDYAKEVAMENDIANVKNLFWGGGTLELAILTFKSLSEEIIKKVHEEVMNSKTLA